MGIDIYLRWELITEDELEKQFCGYDISKGGTGYLREAYHGEPYATRELMPEAFDNLKGLDGAHIPAATLRERLPAVMKAAMRRERTIYKNSNVNEDSPAVRSFIEFVELAERLEAEGKEPMVIASY